jgi:hypothetical protein
VAYANEGKVVFYLRTNGGSGAWGKARTICNQCGDTLMQLKFEVSDLIGRELQDSCGFVTPDELAQPIIPRPHSAHEIRSDVARLLVWTCQERLMSQP